MIQLHVVAALLAIACFIVSAYVCGRASGKREGYNSGYRAGLMHGRQLGTPGNARKREAH